MCTERARNLSKKTKRRKENMSFKLGEFVNTGHRDWTATFEGCYEGVDSISGKKVLKATFSKLRHPDGYIVSGQEDVQVSNIAKEVQKLKKGDRVKFTSYASNQRVIDSTTGYNKYQYIIAGITKIVKFDPKLAVKDDIKQTVWNYKFHGYSQTRISQITDLHTDVIHSIIVENNILRARLKKSKQEMYDFINNLSALGYTIPHIARLSGYKESTVKTYLPTEIKDDMNVKHFLLTA